MRHFISVTYRSGAQTKIELSENTYTVWSVRFTDETQNNPVAKGSVMFGKGPEGEPIILRLKEVAGVSFHNKGGDNPLSDFDHYDNPLN